MLSADARDLKHQDETASLINRAANQEVEEMMENSRTKDQKKYYEIDKSKYDTYPLQKIVFITVPYTVSPCFDINIYFVI